MGKKIWEAFIPSNEETGEHKISGDRGVLAHLKAEIELGIYQRG